MVYETLLKGPASLRFFSSISKGKAPFHAKRLISCEGHFRFLPNSQRDFLNDIISGTRL
jgi:hypothetical protein